MIKTSKHQRGECWGQLGYFPGIYCVCIPLGFPSVYKQLFVEYRTLQPCASLAEFPATVITY
jgi:hypothetical protein